MLRKKNKTKKGTGMKKGKKFEGQVICKNLATAFRKNISTVLLGLSILDGQNYTLHHLLR